MASTNVSGRRCSAPGTVLAYSCNICAERKVIYVSLYSVRDSNRDPVDFRDFIRTHFSLNDIYAAVKDAA